MSFIHFLILFYFSLAESMLIIVGNTGYHASLYAPSSGKILFPFKKNWNHSTCEQAIFLVWTFILKLLSSASTASTTTKNQSYTIIVAVVAGALCIVAATCVVRTHVAIKKFSTFVKPSRYRVIFGDLSNFKDLLRTHTHTHTHTHDLSVSLSLSISLYLSLSLSISLSLSLSLSLALTLVLTLVSSNLGMTGLTLLHQVHKMTLWSLASVSCSHVCVCVCVNCLYLYTCTQQLISAYGLLFHTTGAERAADPPAEAQPTTLTAQTANNVERYILSQNAWFSRRLPLWKQEKKENVFLLKTFTFALFSGGGLVFCV